MLKQIVMSQDTDQWTWDVEEQNHKILDYKICTNYQI